MNSDPPRLLDQDGDAFERALLGSAALDVGSDWARAGCVAAMATASAVVTTTATAQAAALGAKAGSVLFVGKWLAVGTAVGLVATSAVIAVSPTGPDATEAPPAPSVHPPAAPTRQPPQKDTRVRLEAPAATTAASAAEPAPAQSSLAEELRLLDRARSALQQGQPGVALAALNRRDRAHPQGALGPEATVLRVQALLALGDRPAARRVADRWLRRHPRGAHSRRIRSLLNLENP